MVAEDRSLVVIQTCAMEMLVKIVRPVLLGVFSVRSHLKVHASMNVSANQRVRRGPLGRDWVNGQYRRESILSGSAEESCEFVPSVHSGE